MSDAQTLILDGDLGSDVRANLNGLQTRYNESWRQILALSSAGTSKSASQYTTVHGYGKFIGGGGYNWVADYVATGITFASSNWTVDVTGTYWIAFRDMRIEFKHAGPPHAQVAARYVGIGAWVDGVYYELQNYGFDQQSPVPPYMQMEHMSGISAINLTAGQDVQIGSAALYSSSSSHATLGNMHNQGAQVAYVDVYLGETGA